MSPTHIRAILRQASSIFAAIFSISCVAADVSLKLERFDGPGASFRESAAGTVEIHGPMSVRASPSGPIGPEDLVLEMEYFCAGGVPDFALLPGPPFEAKTARYLKAIGHSETWSSYTARIAPEGKLLPETWTELRLDLPLPANRVLQIRNAKLRPERPGEFDTRTSQALASCLLYTSPSPRDS